MNWKAISNEEYYSKAVERAMEIFHAEPGTPEDEELKLLISLIKSYDEKHYPLPPRVDVPDIIKKAQK